MRWNAQIRFRHTVAPTLALAILLGVLVGSPMAQGDGEATLLVKCAPSDVPHVLRSLAGIDVKVYDLATLEPLPTPEPGSVPSKPASPADGLAVMNDLLRITAGVSAAREGERILTVESLSVKPRIATMRVWARGPDVLDSLQAALERDSTLEMRAVEAPYLDFGSAKPHNGGWRQEVSIRLAEPVGAGVLSRTPFPSRDAIAKHLAAEGARMTYASAQRRTLEADGTVQLLTQRFQVEVPSLDGLRRFLARLAFEPGAVVTGIAWKREEKGKETGRPLKTTFSLSCLSPRTASR